jgi:LCP family protein required for cell wall assembly
MIASIKKADGSVRILSVPGETIANIPGRQNIDNINKAYFYGEMQLTIRTIEEMLYFPIHHYAIIEMSAFSDFVDLIDGVNLYVEEDMDYEDAYSGFAIHLKKGYQHLDGAAAEQYVRYRGDELGSISRVQRQQKFIKAMNERLAEMDAVAKLPQFADFIKEKIVISLSPLDAVKLMADLYGLNAQKITIEMLPGEFVSINGRQHWQILEKDKQELLDRLFPIVQAGE